MGLPKKLVPVLQGPRSNNVRLLSKRILWDPCAEGHRDSDESMDCRPHRSPPFCYDPTQRYMLLNPAAKQIPHATETVLVSASRSMPVPESCPVTKRRKTHGRILNHRFRVVFVSIKVEAVRPERPKLVSEKDRRNFRSHRGRAGAKFARTLCCGRMSVKERPRPRVHEGARIP